jgi:hypothetical protein
MMGTASLILAAIGLVCFMAAGVLVVSAHGEQWAGRAMWGVAAGLAGGVMLVASGLVWFFS